ncbi:sorbosone dehydrogenase family protein [Mucilaginibacter sp. UR6-11]|uniref:PQQ-dependent sugar dehydrogenase n=1 Tax=Mucilaginibacter sp. UR6-11 TaxID=1435644 RepID=UPI001E62ED6C|nr:PQQ-dependent sugar dehydrogenase [Mucilaginibacter sp. UR6-11]MCC8423308.1 PQQ-dependent sugar dehydrogenase [Mucilaginibacter sp. UR6-11]
MKNKRLLSMLLPLAAISGLVSLNALKNDPPAKHRTNAGADAGLTLPAGFKATVIAENLGSARHLVITPQNDIYVHIASTRKSKGIIVLHEENDQATIKSSFGDYGGTGIAIGGGYLFASYKGGVYRYKLDANNQVIDPLKPELIVTGLIDIDWHQPKAIALDNKGNIYVNIGAPSNICTEKDKNHTGCPLLDSAAGIWQFKTDELNQSYAEGVHYAWGLRNVVGISWNNEADQLFVMQHGRDALHDLYPKLYTAHQSAELPAECMFALKKGDNAGWPYVYYDWQKKKNMLGPEYGGDGEKAADPKYINPVAAYPGHFAPDALLFYTGSQFPAKYKNGAFIAFHGSWNRAPLPQAGYCVVFQPFKNGRPDGKWEVFADGFAGTAEQKASGAAVHRPTGLAQGPDGSIYVTDDNKGTLYKISYKK